MTGQTADKYPPHQHLSLREVRALTVEVLTDNGLSPEHTSAIADIVTAAERDECPAHGLERVPDYVSGITSGIVDPRASPDVSTMAPAVIRVDARNGYAPLALDIGLPHLKDAACAEGIAVLVVGRCCHIAPLWPEVETIADAGLIAIAMTNTKASVGLRGNPAPVLGTNPIAFGWPRRDSPPMVFDLATSAAARNEIARREKLGFPIPEGWAVDRHGQPTTEPADALAGIQLPFGGYKGMAIALMVELLAGPLVGAPLGIDLLEQSRPGDPPGVGAELMIAIEPSRFGSDVDSRLEASERLFESMLRSPGARLPSDRRYLARARTIESGVNVRSQLLDRLGTMRQP